jgi:predicted secreted Zn-dependent protease
MPLLIHPKGTVPATPTRRLDDASLRELAVNNTGEELGAATFETDLKYEKTNGRITRVDLTFTLVIKMPVWTKYASRSPAERREWDRFYRVLLEHEQGHIAIFRREAQVTYTRLTVAKPDMIDDLLRRETDRIQNLSDAYDTETDHGRKQKSPHGTTVIDLQKF